MRSRIGALLFVLPSRFHANSISLSASIANPRVSVAIIGTAGRGGLSAKMSKPTFTAMVESAKDIVETTWKLPWSQIDLVSGGAAWAGTQTLLLNSWKDF